MSGVVQAEVGSGGGEPPNPSRSSSSPPPPGFSGTSSSSPVSPQLLFSDTTAHGNHDNAGEGVDDDQSSSFSNLAAALGSGLVESMEDATRGDHQLGRLASATTSQAASGHSSASALLSDSFFNPNNDLTYERHKRHAASRLLGVGHTGSSSHKMPEAGSLFGGTFGTGTLMGGVGSATNGEGTRNTSSLQAAAAAASFPHDPNVPPFRPSYESKSSFHDSSNGRNDHKSRLPVTKDLGLTVMEPNDSPFRGAPGQAAPSGLPDWKSSNTDATYGIQRDMQNLWSSDGVRGVGPRSGSRSPAHDGFDSGNLDASEELRPFTWDINHHEPSRTLVVFGAAAVNANDIRNICESFGIVESFRSDFADRGIVFVSFFDMRCAQFAAMQLPPRLQRMGPGADRVQINFCVPLNSSSQFDESLVVINDLPVHINVDNLAQMLSSFGAIRSLKKIGESYGRSSFVVEYHDIQDAKQVVLELESTLPWGPDVSVEVGNRNPADRKKGRELLALIGRWRGQSGGGGGGGGSRGKSPVSAGGLGRDGMYRVVGDPVAMGHRESSPYERGMPTSQHSSQLVLGPDGRYTYGSSYDMAPQGGYPPYGGMGHRNDHHVPGHPSSNYVPHHHQPPQPHHQQHYYAPSQRVGHFAGGGNTVVSGGSHHSGHRSAPAYYGDDRSIGSHRSAPTHIGSLAGSTSDGQNQHLMLDLDAVENGLDTRTSLMVRNIPNKYTQQMLLSEFNENGHGPGVIDFFYLPIDFKNRCNRGYAFINFVDFKDILMFHRQYYGKHWRTFNSDKICDITYARIQGKAAMLKRFENSALMEKDEEYKPLVFVSNGPEKGKRLPFPDPSNRVS
ncbi:RNA recognition motif containing protein [Nitzschia inconspicua]|uniref:RNA recognition motif containing protein n=1 Tax=Nitzschia inconspicua TaxID=303405 RepID=A0A9K3L5C8_9STRA|nr:RNA recognition motif containing protein [Nitzschia inconspicua]